MDRRERVCLENPLLVAINLDNPDHIGRLPGNERQCQVGVCKLDTRDLCSSSRVQDIPILTRNFTVERRSFLDRIWDRFRFGEYHSMSHRRLLDDLESLVPRDRKVVVIGQNLNATWAGLQRLGFDWSSYQVVGVIRIDELARQVLREPGLDFRKLLGLLGLPCANLDSVGDGAHYALRAVLLLAVRSVNGSLSDSSCGTRERSKLIEALGQHNSVFLLLPQDEKQTDWMAWEVPCGSDPSDADEEMSLVGDTDALDSSNDSMDHDGVQLPKSSPWQYDSDAMDTDDEDYYPSDVTSFDDSSDPSDLMDTSQEETTSEDSEMTDPYDDDENSEDPDFDEDSSTDSDWSTESMARDITAMDIDESRDLDKPAGMRRSFIRSVVRIQACFELGTLGWLIHDSNHESHLETQIPWRL